MNEAPPTGVEHLARNSYVDYVRVHVKSGGALYVAYAEDSSKPVLKTADFSATGPRPWSAVKGDELGIASRRIEYPGSADRVTHITLGQHPNASMLLLLPSFMPLGVSAEPGTLIRADGVGHPSGIRQPGGTGFRISNTTYLELTDSTADVSVMDRWGNDVLRGLLVNGNLRFVAGLDADDAHPLNNATLWASNDDFAHTNDRVYNLVPKPLQRLEWDGPSEPALGPGSPVIDNGAGSLV